MIDEFENFTTTTSCRSTTTPISGDAYQTADGVPLESTAASEDAQVNLFSSTFDARSESRTDNSR